MRAKKITSLQHPLVKRWLFLRQERSFREKEGRCLIAGRRMVGELPVEVKISTQEGADYCVTDEIMAKITGLKNSDGFAAEVNLPKEQDVSKAKRLLILDELSDPGNLGTLLRTALALHWDAVAITPNTVDPFNDKALRASKGAIFHLPYARMTHDELTQLKHHFFVADLNGTPLEKISCKATIALVLSNEGQGLNSWAKKADKVTIPMHSQVESLNVAMSGAILLYAMRGQ